MLLPLSVVMAKFWVLFVKLIVIVKQNLLIDMISFLISGFPTPYQKFSSVRALPELLLKGLNSKQWTIWSIIGVVNCPHFQITTNFNSSLDDWVEEFELNFKFSFSVNYVSVVEFRIICYCLAIFIYGTWKFGFSQSKRRLGTYTEHAIPTKMSRLMIKLNHEIIKILNSSNNELGVYCPWICSF